MFAAEFIKMRWGLAAIDQLSLMAPMERGLVYWQELYAWKYLRNPAFSPLM